MTNPKQPPSTSSSPESSPEDFTALAKLLEQWYGEATQVFVNNNLLSVPPEAGVRVVTAGLSMFFASWVNTYIRPQDQDLFFKTLRSALDQQSLLHQTPAGNA